MRQAGHQKLENLIFEFPKFPRAEFGLPIITKFHPDDKDDPGQTILKPSGRDRFGSPLILKPIRIGDNSFVGLALVLRNSTQISDIELTLEEQREGGRRWNTANDYLTSKLNDTEAAEIKTKNNQESLLKAGPNIPKSFLKFLEN
jgi:CRISPR-associated protein Cmr1